ncbi:hypothetical protein IFM89_010706 [Coptis chinensis]|uniref:BFN domain-containing protein n=1 Tax=Coptis chinensis TaxID=261450 RepID=A0A835ILA8_9MAGN|nr:hypothetical protein IFM89_010706 [Coptis chinensis]
MGVLQQGPVVCPSLRTKQAVVMNGRLFSSTVVTKRSCKVGIIKINHFSYKGSVLARRGNIIQCTYSSSSNDNGSTAENFDENNDEYVNSSVVEAVEVKSGADGFMIKMRDGKRFRCVHNNPQSGHLPDYAPHPAIVLKMEDGSDLLLPIIVLEMPSVLLMAAVRNIQIPRPTLYQLAKVMIEKMGYEVKLARVTKRVHEAYFAQLHLSKIGNETERISFDLRPSDAINIAVRCKVPIQVNKYLAYSDGMRIIEPAKLATEDPHSDGLLFSTLDRPDGKPCVETKEFDLVRNMLIAAVEERYRDAGIYLTHTLFTMPIISVV